MKILILRFSSIGDIVLTTPVVRCLRTKFPDAELHYLTKKSFATVIANNPHINRVHVFDKNTDEVAGQLRNEKFDLIVDLHRNIRSARLKKQLGVKSVTFSKINLQKWLRVNTPLRVLPRKHIVDRYFEALQPLGVINDNRGLEFYVADSTKHAEDLLPAYFKTGYVALVIGARHATKRIPDRKLTELIAQLHVPVVLLGGAEDAQRGDDVILRGRENVFNAAGKFSLHESAAIIRQAEVVITPDTGLMHIAAAYRKRIISVWGNTVPEFGMYPYMPGDEAKSDIREIKDLRCRPCSKLGYDACPRRHFNCMNRIDYSDIAASAEKRL